jgi:hypothetical protein
MTAKVLRLLDLYGSVVMQSAASDLLERGAFDPGALALLCEQHRQRLRGAAVHVPLAFAKHVVERDVLQHDLGGYDV